MPQQWHRLIASMTHLTDAGFFVLKEPRPSTEYINEQTLKSLNFSVWQILFLIDLRQGCAESSSGQGLKYKKGAI